MDKSNFRESILDQQKNFDKWTELAKRMQEPFQTFVDLNVKTLQGMSYIKPEEFASLKKPEELLEKQVNLAVENGHKALEYMQKSFQILEKAMLGIVQEAKKSNEHDVKH